MKKTTALIFILLLAAAAYGQETSTPTDKGNMMFGGMLNIMSLFGNFYENSTTIILTPFGSYFIKNNIMVGGMFQLVMNFQEGFSQTAINVGPWVGYTFKKFKPGEEIPGAFIPFAKAGFLLSSASTKWEEWKTSHSGFAIPIGVGAIYMVSRTLGLMGDIYIALERQKMKDADKGEGAGRFVISLGLSYTHYKK